MAYMDRQTRNPKTCDTKIANESENIPDHVAQSSVIPACELVAHDLYGGFQVSGVERSRSRLIITPQAAQRRRDSLNYASIYY